MPPTIQALLASRLDQLDMSERAVLERGAVEGQVFHRGAVEALAPDEERVAQRLLGLVRKELVRPDQPQFPGEDAYRFRHLLIRDAAYDALPKAVRADLHERFAVWLGKQGATLVELDEIVGYHLEQACRFRRDLGLDDQVAELAMVARSRLLAAGRHARLRDDFPAAVNLLERAAHVAPSAPLDLVLEFERADAVFEAGRTTDAIDIARALARRGAEQGDRVAELTGRILEADWVTHLEPEGATDRLEALIAQALPELEEAGNDLALYIAHNARGSVANIKGRSQDLLSACELAVEHAKRAGQPHLATELVSRLGMARLFGPTPVPDLLVWLDEQEVAHPGSSTIHVLRAAALAMLGRFAEARELINTARDRLREQGATLGYALVTGQVAADVELLGDDPARAAELSRESARLLEDGAERAWLSTIVGVLARALYRLDRLDEADAQARRAADLGSSDDRLTQMLWRQTCAKVHARRGNQGNAQRLAREAVAIGEEMDDPNHLGNAYSDLAEVLVLAGDYQQAVEAFTCAVNRYSQKGNVVARDRALEQVAKVAGTRTHDRG